MRQSEADVAHSFERVSTLDLRIAGLWIHVHADEPMALLAEQQAYQRFCLTERYAGTPDLDVYLRRVDRITETTQPTLFHAGSWSVRSDGHQLCLRSHRCGTATGAWMAMLDLDAKELILDVVAPPGRLPMLFRYPLDQIILIHVLAGHQTMMCHAAGIVWQGHGVLLCGPSGAGKTTVSRLLSSHPEIRVLSDDRILLRQHRETFDLYGTPWPGDGGFAENRSARLRRIWVLARDGKNHQEPLLPGTALQQMLPIASVPWYLEGVRESVLAVLAHAVISVPAERVWFTPDAEGLRSLLSAMTDEQ